VGFKPLPNLVGFTDEALLLLGQSVTLPVIALIGGASVAKCHQCLPGDAVVDLYFPTWLTAHRHFTTNVAVLWQCILLHWIWYNEVVQMLESRT